MTTIALKKYLVSKINLLEDESILEKLKTIVDKNEATYELSSSQIQLINEAQEEIKKGEYISQDEMDLKVQAWEKRK